MNFLSPLAPHAHWFLRLSLASVFIYHAVTKFPNLEGVSQMIGFPVFLVAVLAVVELLGGILILLGGISKDWMTRLAGLIFVVVMIGAIFKVHLAHGWNSIGNRSCAALPRVSCWGFWAFISCCDGWYSSRWR